MAKGARDSRELVCAGVATFPPIMVLAVLVLLCLVTGGLPLKITKFEVPHAVEAGESATILCDFAVLRNESDPIVQWWWIRADGSRKLAYQRVAGRSPQILKQSFNITHMANDSLLLLDLMPEYSGSYVCVVFTKQEEVRRSGQMIVYTKGTGPKVRVTELSAGSSEGEESVQPQVLLECEADGAAPQPDLVLSVNGILRNETLMDTTIDNGFFNITRALNVTKEDAEGAEMKCELVFLDHSLNHPLYIDTLKYSSSGGEEAPAEAPRPVADAASAPPPPAEDSSSRLNSSLMMSSILLAVILSNNWLSWSS